MALTPNTLVLQRTRVRLLVQEPTSQYWADATLTAYINEAQFDIAVGCPPGVATGQEEPLLATEATVPSVTDQEVYSMPPNMHAIRTVRARSSSTDTYTELPARDVEYVRVHPTGTTGSGTSSQPKPSGYFLWGESGTYQLGVYPPFNSANGTIWVSYWRQPTVLSADGDVLQLPLELQIANTYLASHKAWLERGHDADADRMLKMFVTEYKAKLPFVIRRQNINTKRAVILGSIGDDDTERTLP